jgi:hypothetical protein
MKRLLWACLGVVALAGPLPERGSAQTDPPRIQVSISGDVHGAIEREYDQRVRDWWVGLYSALRSELGPNVLVGVHPLITFVPAESFVDARSGEATPGFTNWPADVTCPFLVRQLLPQAVPVAEPPDVLANLQLLMRAEYLMKRGEELARTGQFSEAVDCFQEIHRLVPGTNLEARAGAATQNLLVRVYGTATENGVVDEPAEQEEVLPPPTPCTAACPQACTKCSSFAAARVTKKKDDAPAPAAEHSGKPRTVVYPVADLLGRGKETGLDDLDELIGTIVNTVEPSSWADNGGEATIDYYYRSRAIVVRQTADVHDQIAEVLAGLRQARAESENGEVKPHGIPLTGRAAKANAGKPRCAECCSANSCPKTADPAAAKTGCCDECCPAPVLTLPTTPAAEGKERAGKLEIVVEGCTGEGENAAPSKGFHWAAGGACAEAANAADGLRFRWQMPLGLMTVLVRYEHHELSVGLGLTGQAEMPAEESENPR